ncbi:MAG: glycosyltransferase family A protein [Chloroflexota bacterium]
MSNPLVSVVIPVHNGERYLEAALRSVEQQDYEPVEIIVVDDGSSDGSARVSWSHTGVRYLYQLNQGVAAARNWGIDVASGEFIAFLDQDDRWVPHKLSAQVGYLLGHPEVEFVLSRQRHLLEPGTPRPAWLRPRILESDQLGSPPGCWLVRRQTFDRIGRFDPSLVNSSDTDWLTRAKDAGGPMAVLPEVLLLRRIHDSNASYQTATTRAELLRVMRRSIDRQRHRGIPR